MNKKETLEVLKIVVAAFPNFKIEDAQLTVEVWYEILKDVELIEAKNNLKAYIRTGTSYPPVVGQLLGVREKRAIPNVQETRYMITQMEQLEKENQKSLQDPEEKRRIQELQAEGRRNLGMPVRTEGQG